MSENPEPAAHARDEPRPAVSLCVGAFFMLLALALETVTTANTSYAPFLIGALVFVLLANARFVSAYRAGGVSVRLLSVVFALPTLFVVWDFLRRAPYVFFE